jgi:hypothetical protein
VMVMDPCQPDGSRQQEIQKIISEIHGAPGEDSDDSLMDLEEMRGGTGEHEGERKVGGWGSVSPVSSHYPITGMYKPGMYYNE